MVDRFTQVESRSVLIGMRPSDLLVAWTVLALAAGCDDAPTALTKGSIGPAPTSAFEDGDVPAAIYCDPTMETATVLDGGEVVSANRDGSHDLIRLDTGRPLVRVKSWPSDGKYWSASGRYAVSLENGATVEMSAGTSIFHLVESSATEFWFIAQQDSEHGGAWSYGRYVAGHLTQFPLSDGDFTYPLAPLLQNGALWGQTGGCALLRMGSDGIARCLIEDRIKLTTNLVALGPDHLVHYRADFTGDFVPASIYDTARRQAVELGCEHPMELRALVKDQPAVVFRCGPKTGAWSARRGITHAMDDRYQPSRWPEVYDRFLPLAPNKFYDSVGDEVVVATVSPLSIGTSGFGWVEGRVVDWSRRRSRPFDGPECGFFDGGPTHEFEHWRLLTCAREIDHGAGRELRRRPRTLKSCTSPAPKPRQIYAQELVDLRDGSVHSITGLKIAGLTRHGIVGVRGSGHDLLETSADGSQIVLQPYPTSRSNPDLEWEPLDVRDAPWETSESPTSQGDYEEAVFEYTCLFRSSLPAEVKASISAKIFARYGLSHESFAAAEQSRRLSPRAMMQIYTRAEACTDESALRLGDD